MMAPDIPYELHDSVIVSVFSCPGRKASLVIDLYPIFYPEKPRIVLSFEGIVNFDKVEHYVKLLENEAEEDSIGCRIERFQYDTEKKSTASDLWFFFETEWCGPVRINCARMTMEPDIDTPKE